MVYYILGSLLKNYHWWCDTTKIDLMKYFFHWINIFYLVIHWWLSNSCSGCSLCSGNKTFYTYWEWSGIMTGDCNTDGFKVEHRVEQVWTVCTESWCLLKSHEYWKRRWKISILVLIDVVINMKQLYILLLCLCLCMSTCFRQMHVMHGFSTT